MEFYILVADIQNAYLTAPYIICITEFWYNNIGKEDTIKRSLYGTKFPGWDFRNNICDCMYHLG